MGGPAGTIDTQGGGRGVPLQQDSKGSEAQKVGEGGRGGGGALPDCYILKMSHSKGMRNDRSPQKSTVFIATYSFHCFTNISTNISYA
jgi:hypothetical protein